MKRERIVILGNGGAAVNAAKSARASGHIGEIHILSDTNTSAFNPMLSPYYLKGTIPWDNCFPFRQNVYSDYGITFHSDSPVESLDAVDQLVTLARGEKLSYDRCLIATGASPVIPPVPGLRDSHRSHTLRNACSVRSMEKAMRSARRALVLGASLVGLKVAEILRRKGIDVILLDVVDQILPNSAHPASAAILTTYFEEQGVDVRLGCVMSGMDGAKDGVACHFSESIIEEVDFVAVCAGIRPNIDFVKRDQLEIKEAILVDERMQTTAQNLYAAGDVSQGFNPFSGECEWFRTWGNACIQGRIAGCNMTGRDVVYPGSIPQHISPFFGWTYAQLGDAQPHGKEVNSIMFGDPRQGGHFVLAFKQDRLIGANLINCTHLAGKFKRAIVQKWNWSYCLERSSEYFKPSMIEVVLNQRTDNTRPLREPKQGHRGLYGHAPASKQFCERRTYHGAYSNEPQ